MHNNFNLTFHDSPGGHVTEQFECSFCHLTFATVREARDHHLSGRVQTRRLSWKAAPEPFFDTRNMRETEAQSIGSSDRSCKLSMVSPKSISCRSRSDHSSYGDSANHHSIRQDESPLGLNANDEDDLLSENLSLDLVPAPNFEGRFSTSYCSPNKMSFPKDDNTPKTAKQSAPLATKTTTTVTTIRTAGQHAIVRKCREEVFAPANFHRTHTLGVQRLPSGSQKSLGVDYNSSNKWQPGTHRHSRRARASTLVESTWLHSRYDYSADPRSPSVKAARDYLGPDHWDRSEAGFSGSHGSSSSGSMRLDKWAGPPRLSRGGKRSANIGNRRASGAIDAMNTREAIYDEFSCRGQPVGWSTERSGGNRTIQRTESSNAQKRSPQHQCNGIVRPLEAGLLSPLWSS